MSNTITDLPKNILIEISSYLFIRDLARLACVSDCFNKIKKEYEPVILDAMAQAFVLKSLENKPTDRSSDTSHSTSLQISCPYRQQTFDESIQCRVKSAFGEHFRLADNPEAYQSAKQLFVSAQEALKLQLWDLSKLTKELVAQWIIEKVPAALINGPESTEPTKKDTARELVKQAHYYYKEQVSEQNAEFKELHMEAWNLTAIVLTMLTTQMLRNLPEEQLKAVPEVIVKYDLLNGRGLSNGASEEEKHKNEKIRKRIIEFSQIVIKKLGLDLFSPETLFLKDEAVSCFLVSFSCLQEEIE